MVELGLLAAAVVAALLVWRKRSATPRKQCPECGAYVDAAAHDCKYCGYVFEAPVTAAD